MPSSCCCPSCCSHESICMPCPAACPAPQNVVPRSGFYCGVCCFDLSLDAVLNSGSPWLGWMASANTTSRRCQPATPGNAAPRAGVAAPHNINVLDGPCSRAGRCAQCEVSQGDQSTLALAVHCSCRQPEQWPLPLPCPPPVWCHCRRSRCCCCYRDAA